MLSRSNSDNQDYGDIRVFVVQLLKGERAKRYKPAIAPLNVK